MKSFNKHFQNMALFRYMGMILVRESYIHDKIYDLIKFV
jgi:hypothetical protein